VFKDNIALHAAKLRLRKRRKVRTNICYVKCQAERGRACSYCTHCIVIMPGIPPPDNAAARCEYMGCGLHWVCMHAQGLLEYCVTLLGVTVSYPKWLKCDT